MKQETLDMDGPVVGVNAIGRLGSRTLWFPVCNRHEPYSPFVKLTNN